MLAAPAGGDYSPRTVVTPVLHVGDPAPGIPGATVVLLPLPPQIDGAGNVLVWGQFVYEGGTTGYDALWYRGPSGLEVIAYEGMQVPDMPRGVTYRWMFEHLAECGRIGITAFVQGPGIVPGFNDLVNFAGPPEDIRKVLQGGDPAPGLEPGTIIDASRGTGLTAWLSDNARMMVVAWLAGPGIDETNDQAIWIGAPDDLQLIWRKGMEAPGTGGARFAWANFAVFNDQRQIAFIGGLVHEPGIDYTNHVGIWSGPGGGLRLVARYGDPAPGTTGQITGLNPPSFNRWGNLTFSELISDEDAGIVNDNALWTHVDGVTCLIGRNGDAVPDIASAVELGAIGNPTMRAVADVFYVVKYRGVGVDESNEWAMWLGSCGDPREVLRDDSPAPSFPMDIRLRLVGIAPGVCALNEHGDIVTGSEMSGSGVSEQDNVIVWLRDSFREIWFPLLRSGTVIDERALVIRGVGDLSDSYWNKTSGSDGRLQSLNDGGQLAIRLEFTDGTHGVFVAHLEWPGDSDGDRDVDLTDFASLQQCYGKAVGEFESECDAFDFNGNRLVDLVDYDGFVQQVTGPWNPREEVIEMSD
jgi:hypothetical protein